MTDESQDPPRKKLKLPSAKGEASRDAPPPGSESSSESALPQSKPMRLKPRAEPEPVAEERQLKPPSGLAISDNSIKDEEITSETKQPLKLSTAPIATNEPATAQAQDTESVDVRPPGPELTGTAPTKPAENLQAAPKDELEEKINALDEKIEPARTQPASSDTFLFSILTLAVFAVLIGGAGYGIWAILKEPSADSTSESASPSENNEPSNLIDKARATIAKIPVADIDQIKGETQTKTPSDEQNLADTPIAPSTTPSISDNKQAVSKYLSGIHIDGSRKGDNPAVMIGGKLYGVGDMIEEKTGLKFAGFRNAKLAFEDSNGIVYLKSF